MSKNNEKRRNEILKKLEQQPSLRIKELAESFQVTTETLRKDLFVLEQRGQVNKTHGYVHRKDGYDELPIEVKVEENTELKDQIARKAIEFVSDFSVVYLDPGSTTLSIVRYFALKKGCTIVTPSILGRRAFGTAKEERHAGSSCRQQSPATSDLRICQTR